ncbi:MAG: TolC family protein, partial [Deltaproteobacteria bacterium]|nr:TolC family protein [Deltaproteobacteria bacterium]
MNLRAKAVSFAALLGPLACASTQIGEDVARVRELTRAEELPRVAGLSVDPRSDAEVDRLLGAPLDAGGAVRAALLGNRELRATLRELDVPRGRLVQAGLLPNPTAELELLPERNSEVELRAEYDVTHALLAPLRAHAVAPEVEAARLRAASLVLDLGFRARAAFYRAQAAEERFSLATSMVDASAAGRDAARALHASGNLPELDAASREAA